MNQEVVINARKFDGSIHRSWNCELIKTAESLLIFKGIFSSEIKHADLGIIRPGTISYEYYWLDRWYNVFRFHEPDGAFRNFYCNVNTPPNYSAGVLDYIDLDVDVLITKEFEIEVLDLEEYEVNAAKFKYSQETKNKVEQSIAELIYLAKNRLFPFNFVYF